MDEDGKRALAYLAALERSGYFPTMPELEAYVERPARRRSKRSKLPGIEVFAQTLASAFFFADEVEEEHLGAYLIRLRWVVHNGDVRLTALGRAVHAAAARQDERDEAVAEIVLDEDDPLVLAKLFGKISSVGEALLVDPYFRIDHLMSVVQATGITRILTSTKTASADRDALAVALGSLGPGVRGIEVRVADGKLHDRHVVAVNGTVLLLGASLNGIGRVSSVVVEMSDSAEAVAKNCEKMWRGADRIEPVPPTSTTGPE